jgi:hypothetical protein
MRVCRVALLSGSYCTWRYLSLVLGIILNFKNRLEWLVVKLELFVLVVVCAVNVNLCFV